MKLTTIIVDPSPVALLNEPCGYRRVTIELTPVQRKALELRKTGSQGGTSILEHYGTTFIEVDESEKSMENSKYLVSFIQNDDEVCFTWEGEALNEAEALDLAFKVYVLESWEGGGKSVNIKSLKKD